MMNLFSEKVPDLLYDLKGSQVGRSTPENERKPGYPPFSDFDYLFAKVYL